MTRTRRRNPDGLRSYGPGKFDLMIDAAVYGASLDGGPDEEIGDVESTGWYGFMKAPLTTPESEDAEDLTAPERRFLKRQKAAILSADSQGFVGVEYFTSIREARARWREIEQDVVEAEGEVDDDYDESDMVE